MDWLVIGYLYAVNSNHMTWLVLHMISIYLYYTIPRHTLHLVQPYAYILAVCASQFFFLGPYTG